MDSEKIKKAVTMILEAIGEDTGREGLLDTPRRVADMYGEIFKGVQVSDEDLKKIIVTFTATYDEDEMVIVKDIPFYSMCEHHLLPFFGKAHVAYFPKDNKVTGLSKIARAVAIISRAPQLQEKLTVQIADAIMDIVDPMGVFVIVEAEHLCMIMRGIKKPGSKTVTSAIRGAFKRKSTREEALFLIKGGK